MTSYTEICVFSQLMLVSSIHTVITFSLSTLPFPILSFHFSIFLFISSFSSALINRFSLIFLLIFFSLSVSPLFTWLSLPPSFSSSYFLFIIFLYFIVSLFLHLASSYLIFSPSPFPSSLSKPTFLYSLFP